MSISPVILVGVTRTSISGGTALRRPYSSARVGAHVPAADPSAPAQQLVGIGGGGGGAGDGEEGERR